MPLSKLVSPSVSDNISVNHNKDTIHQESQTIIYKGLLETERCALAACDSNDGLKGKEGNQRSHVFIPPEHDEPSLLQYAFCKTLEGMEQKGCDGCDQRMDELGFRLMVVSVGRSWQMDTYKELMYIVTCGA